MNDVQTPTPLPIECPDNQALHELQQVQAALRMQADRNAILAGVSRLLARNLDLGIAIPEVTRLIAERLTDCASVRLLSPDGRFLDLAAAHFRGSGGEKAAAMVAFRLPFGPNWDRLLLGAGCVVEVDLAGGLPGAPPGYLDAIAGQGIGRVMACPLLDEDRAIGLLLVGRAGRAFEDDDRDLLNELAGRISLALTNARLYEQAQWRLQEREAVESQLRAQVARNRLMAELSAALAEDLAVQGVLDRAAECLGNLMRADCFMCSRGSDGVDFSVRARSIREPTPALIEAADRAASVPLVFDDSLVGQAIETGEPVFLPFLDLAQHIRDVPLPLRNPTLAFSYHSLMIVPLRQNDEPVGVLTLMRRGDARPFTPDDLETVRQSALRISVSLANARLHASTMAALADREAAEARLRVQLQRGRLVTALADAMAESGLDARVMGEQAVREVGRFLAASCVLWQMPDEGDELETLGVWDDDPEAVRAAREHLAANPSTLEQVPFGEVVRRNRPVFRKSVEPEFHPAHFGFLRAIGANSYIVVPLRFGGQVLGLLAALRCGDAPPLSEQEVPLLQAAADRVASSLAHARLYRQARAAEERATAMAARNALLADLSEQLARDLDLAAVLCRSAQRISQVIGESCFIRLRSADGQYLDLAAFDTVRAELAADIKEILGRRRFRATDGISGAVLASGVPSFQPTTAPPDYVDRIEPDQRDFAHRAAFYSQMVVPLEVRGERLGILAVVRHTPGLPYSEHDFELVRALADRVAMAVANARLYEAARGAAGQME